MAIFEGDIILARNPQEIEKLSPEPKVRGEHEPSVRPSIKPVVRKGDEFRWPRGEIPYATTVVVSRDIIVVFTKKDFDIPAPY